MILISETVFLIWYKGNSDLFTQCKMRNYTSILPTSRKFVMLFIFLSENAM
jgi:hypothetical protein